MYERLLHLLRCPTCDGELILEPLVRASGNGDGEVSEGLLQCSQSHLFPIVRGIPRMLPDAFAEHFRHLQRVSTAEARARLEQLAEGRAGIGSYDRRTRQNFSFEWEHYEVGDRTWGMELEDRVRGFFLEPLRLPREGLRDAVVLDAGCGNGSQSVAYTEFGAEVVAMDLSSGLEHGYAFRHQRPAARPDRVHFVQADLQSPPLAPASVDIIHSAGVLHHTPSTERTFRRLCPLLRAGGTFYVWVYAYEPVVTPIVNGLRAITVRVPPPLFARIANRLAGAFQLFTRTVDRLGIRSYGNLSRREAALGLMDIFGAPYAHYHSFPEVRGWFLDEGFEEVWEVNRSRRGFGACGRRGRERSDDSTLIRHHARVPGATKG